MATPPDAIFPTLLWAQRPDFVLLTVPLPNARDVSVELLRDGRELRFGATAGAPPRPYRFAVELFRAVAPEESGHAAGPRQVELRLRKRGPAAGAGEDEAALCRAWPRLVKEKGKNPRIQVDWARWVDEDDDDNDGDGEGAAGDEDGEFGGNFGDMMTQMMMQQAHAEAEETVGGAVPKFGEAAGQQAMPAEAVMNAKDSDSAEDDFGDLPPLEE